ncbi:hypothetical protein [Pseudoxanthomonas indica]|uniref:Uncharacterized protein n=1 Tax=Pseudoxanthomonas indica TaxID=428993 RepID=A0A1T5J1W0_9GAMM|nr:hypothetical protein [Pseudoxanthomonas indica]GGD55856.1 hypothetical protein GCM10007235_30310 [Pseudoxanthomonas indica]SKC45465.1 hypothetical protein SAMN06296058_0455 [Pseudoxanthomonas indica]
MLFLKQALLAVLLIAGIVSVLLAQRELGHLQRDRPDVLDRAGIVKIDWWWKCLAGMGRLGFTAAGESLSVYSRSVFKLVAFTYAWLVVALVVGIAGRLN